MSNQSIDFIESEETAPLRGIIGNVIGDLENLSYRIYKAKDLHILPKLDIRQLPEYLDVVCVPSSLREAAARKYHEQNDIPLE